MTLAKWDKPTHYQHPHQFPRTPSSFFRTKMSSSSMEKRSSRWPQRRTHPKDDRLCSPILPCTYSNRIQSCAALQSKTLLSLSERLKKANKFSFATQASKTYVLLASDQTIWPCSWTLWGRSTPRSAWVPSCPSTRRKRNVCGSTRTTMVRCQLTRRKCQTRSNL